MNEAVTPKKSRKRSDATREAIKAAGATLFSEKGYRATGVRDIAELAGCNQALIAYHFGGKGPLYDEILAEGVAAAGSALHSGDLKWEKNPARQLVRVFADALAARSYLPAMILREQLDPERFLEPRSAGILRGFMAITESAVAATEESALVRNWDPQLVHLSVISPLAHFLVTKRVRSATASTLSAPVSDPELDQFVRVLGDMMTRSFE